MYTLMVVIHVIVCVVLCVIVLLQSSKGSGLAGAFGGGGGLPQQIFGARGMTTLLHKLTIYLAAAFFVTSALLFGLTSRQPSTARSIVREAAQKGQVPVPTPPMSAPEGGFPAAPPGGAGAGAPPSGGTSPTPPAGQGQQPPAGK